MLTNLRCDYRFFLNRFQNSVVLGIDKLAHSMSTEKERKLIEIVTEARLTVIGAWGEKGWD